MLSQAQIDFFWGARLPAPAPGLRRRRDGPSRPRLDRHHRHLGGGEPGLTGPWRNVYMDQATEAASKLVHIHDLQFYSEAWLRALTKPALCDAMEDLLGPNVELHHSTLHAKPPQTGHPFPMHQDSPFYQHTDQRYVDILVHLDDTSHANGEIRFLAGSHKAGHLPHITETPDGPCTPHLPTDAYRLEETVPVPAKRGDVVCFNIYTIHGSYINTTDRVRRMVRAGYRDPENHQPGAEHESSGAAGARLASPNQRSGTVHHRGRGLTAPDSRGNLGAGLNPGAQERLGSMSWVRPPRGRYGPP
ncbi:MAG: phytanoyl-CoA dioxygenase family protein [Gammaproteobacteria bacterium]|nr:phytanoyl-CoA dioxygenase family protein [Gammaproteobacteria bacterium]